MNPDLIGAWVAAGLTLFIFSFLYEDNPLFKLSEHLYVGVTVGYGVSLAFWSVLKPKWYEPLMRPDPDWTVLFPTLLGLMLITQMLPGRFSWPSRWAMAAVMGMGVGMAIPLTVNTYLFAQAAGTVVPLARMTAEGAVDTSASALWADFSALLVLVGVLSVLVYFFYSVEHKGAVRPVSRIGVLFLMVFFGASYGNTVQGRFALLYGRFAELVEYSGPEYRHATTVLAGILLLVLIALRLTRRKA